MLLGSKQGPHPQILKYQFHVDIFLVLSLLLQILKLLGSSRPTSSENELSNGNNGGGMQTSKENNVHM